MWLRVSASQFGNFLFTRFLLLPHPVQRIKQKFYLFIITAVNQQGLSTQKPVGGDWMPDLFDSKLPHQM